MIGSHHSTIFLSQCSAEIKAMFLRPKMISKIQLIGNKEVTLFVKLNR